MLSSLSKNTVQRCSIIAFFLWSYIYIGRLYTKVIDLTTHFVYSIIWPYLHSDYSNKTHYLNSFILTYLTPGLTFCSKLTSSELRKNYIAHITTHSASCLFYHANYKCHHINQFNDNFEQL